MTQQNKELSSNKTDVFLKKLGRFIRTVWLAIKYMLTGLGAEIVRFYDRFSRKLKAKMGARDKAAARRKSASVAKAAARRKSASVAKAAAKEKSVPAQMEAPVVNRRVKAPKENAGAKKAFTRRPAILRAAASYAMIRQNEEPQRYLTGIEAAEMFELSERDRTSMLEINERQDDPAKNRTGFVGFLYRHRKGLIAACVLLSLTIAGYFTLNKLYYSKELFITDVEQAGNITITDRLTTNAEDSEKVSYFLLCGVDDSSMLTDCIWIMCFDNEAHKMSVMQVPRDTYVGFEDSPDTAKINNVYGSPKTIRWCEACGLTPPDEEMSNGVHTACGTETEKVKESNISALIRVINERLGLPIDHFVIFNFRGFAKIVDTIGGVDIHLDRGIHDGAITLSAGDHHLSGWQAVDYMRHRKSYSEGDVGRVSAQRIMVNALLAKALDMDVSTIMSVVTNCFDCFQTDLAIAEIKDYVFAVRAMNLESLEMFTMPGYDHWVRPNPSYYVCDEEETAQMINEKLLPYGLPGGGYATADSVNFPTVQDRLGSGTTRTTTRRTESTTTSSHAVTTTTTQDYGGWETTTTTTTTTVPTTNYTTTTTDGWIVVTTTTAEPTTTTTAAPTTTTTTDYYVDGYIPSGSPAQLTPLSDPRS